jgi:hypothetical protein
MFASRSVRPSRDDISEWPGRTGRMVPQTRVPPEPDDRGRRLSLPRSRQPSSLTPFTTHESTSAHSRKSHRSEPRRLQGSGSGAPARRTVRPRFRPGHQSTCRTPALTLPGRHTYVVLFIRLDPPADLIDRGGHCDRGDPYPAHVHPGERGGYRSCMEEGDAGIGRCTIFSIHL